MKALSEYAALIGAALETFLPAPPENALEPGKPPRILGEAMRYSLFAGGKRLRPAMLLAAVDMLDGNIDEAMAIACGLEMIHTYSLIHDDLPCMDDSPMRRGKPSNHVEYGDGQAVLAGDGLLTHAFFVMTKNALEHTENIGRHLSAINEIANAAGISGMVAGQCMDLICESGIETGEDTLRYIQINKTAKLFIAAMRAAGRLAGAGEEEMGSLSLFGLKYGLLFQAADDINDAAGETGKLTAVTVFGIEGAKREAIKLIADAVRAISPFGDKAEFFKKLARETYYSSLQGPQGLT